MFTAEEIARIPVITDGAPVPPEGGIVIGRPLRAAADIERQIREENARHERAITDLQDNYLDIIETAVALGHVEEVHPWGTYRIETTITPGRRSIDEAAFRDRFPQHCETVVKAPTLAKAEKLLRADEIAAVVKHGEPKTARTLRFEPAPLAFEEAYE
jgi:hypothetical protein